MKLSEWMMATAQLPLPDQLLRWGLLIGLLTVTVLVIRHVASYGVWSCLYGDTETRPLTDTTLPPAQHH